MQTGRTEPLVTRHDTDVRFILASQDPNGAYLASPSFSQYPYCWLRDGSFIAHAMDVVGQSASAAAFHTWVATTLAPLDDHVRSLIRTRDEEGRVDHDRMLPARFRVDGRAERDGWPDFQLDGYGQWLWSLERHVWAGGDFDERLRLAASTVADYLATFWNEPCFDAWEEGRTQHHGSTLASAAAGLRAATRLLGASYEPAATASWRFVQERCVMHGHFTKRFANPAVDASLVWLATPFDLVSDSDETFTKTLAKIERELIVDGGVHRYLADTFYGGGAWNLLTAGLAWHHARSGRQGRARELLAWIESTRASDGALPEQVPTRRTDRWFHHYWSERWGPSASPLSWSHAMVILAKVATETPDS